MSAADDEEAAKLKFENWSPCVVRIAILSSTLQEQINQDIFEDVLKK